MTEADLRAAERAYRRAAEKAEKAREARDEALVRALREGMTHAQIARATGLTRGRVGQLAGRLASPRA